MVLGADCRNGPKNTVLNTFFTMRENAAVCRRLLTFCENGRFERVLSTFFTNSAVDMWQNCGFICRSMKLGTDVDHDHGNIF